MRILGVDHQIRGVLAIIEISDGAALQLIDAIDIPVAGVGAKERVDVLAIRAWIETHWPQHAFIERAQAMPKQGASSGFTYGRSVGAIDAVIACCGISLTIVEPAQWKRFHHFRGGDKEAARQRALQLFPAAHALLARKKDHGRGEAALIALARNAGGNARCPLGAALDIIAGVGGAHNCPSPQGPLNSRRGGDRYAGGVIRRNRRKRKWRPDKAGDSKMANEIAKKPMHELDGFDTFEDAVEGDDAQVSSRIIQGPRIKFGDASSPTTWMQADGEPLSPGSKVAIDVVRVVQKWPPGGNSNPPDTRVLGPGEKFPDVDKLNAETPQAEWRIGPDGNPKGPYEHGYILYLLDPTTMARFTYVATTIGGMRAVRELRDRVQWMRRFRGISVYPVVTPSDTFMPTRYGGRQRPHFVIERWVTFGDGGECKVLPAPTSPTLPPATEAAALDLADVRDGEVRMRTVQPPSAKEAVNDEIPR